MPRFPLPDKFADGDLVTFKKAFQRVAKANGWDEDGQLAALPLALSGRALIAFERGESGFKTSEDAFKYLETEFDKALDKETAMKSFNACRWGEGLDPTVFANRLKGLLLRGLPSLKNSDVERMVSAQFISGFPSVLREKLGLLFAGKTPTLDEVIAAARDLVRDDPVKSGQAFALRIGTTMEDPRHDDTRMKELENKVDELVDHVAALSARDEASGLSRRAMTVERGRGPGVRERGRGRHGSSVRCYNCAGYGHIARVCPSPLTNQKSGNGKPGDRRPTAIPQPGANWSA